MGMDFIGPFTTSQQGKRFILNVGCYMSRFIIPFATQTANVPEVIWSLKLLFNMYRKPQAFYIDREQHFDNDELRAFFGNEGVAVEYSPSGASKSTGFIEERNLVLENVLRKDSREFDEALADAGSVNTHVINHLGVCPAMILFGEVKPPSTTISTLLSNPGRDPRTWAEDFVQNHPHRVRQYLGHRAEPHDLIREVSKPRKEEEAIRYSKGIQRVSHTIGRLVMLYQKDQPKLHPRWRGPFRVIGYGGSHYTSFRIQQLNGRGIRGTFHGDHLKQFIPRTGHLSMNSLPTYPQHQTIRRPRKRRQVQS